MSFDIQFANLKNIAQRDGFISSLYSTWSQLSLLSYVEKHNTSAQRKEIPQELKEHYIHGFVASQTTQQTIEIYPVHNHPAHIDFAYTRATEILKRSVNDFDKIASIDVAHEQHPNNDSIVKVTGSIKITTSFN
mgnify:CR=1 FL=1